MRNVAAPFFQSICPQSSFPSHHHTFLAYTTAMPSGSNTPRGHSASSSTASASRSRPASTVVPPDWQMLAAHSASGSSILNKAVKHLRIEQPSQSIKGRFPISPYAAEAKPPRFDPPHEADLAESSASAVFEAKSSAVGAHVIIHGHAQGSDANVEGAEEQQKVGFRRRNSDAGAQAAGAGGVKQKKLPVVIKAKSYFSNVDLIVPQYPCARPLRLRCKTHAGGDIHLYLPPTFSGLLSFTSEAGKLRLSPTMQARCKQMGNETHKHRGLVRVDVADWVIVGKGSGTSPAQQQQENLKGTWGDSAETITARGDVFVYESTEAKEGSSCIVM